MYLRLCELLEIPDDLHLDFAEAVLAHYLKPDSWATFQDVLPILEFLADQGIKMGLISNWDCSLRSIITGMGLDHFFNCAIASAEVQSYKPNDRIFLMALEQLKAKPWQAYHIGDHETADVQGARAVGITPVYLNREGHKLDETASIKSLLELPEIIF
jgi:putative hydrolase of the HAD superfamily